MRNFMRKVSLCFIILCVGINILFECTSYQCYENSTKEKYTCGEEYTYNYEDVKNILIRFHVIANSDNEQDQNLKLKVRDKVINYLYPLLKDSQSINESRKILCQNEEKVKDIAINTIEENGYNYPVKIMLSKENFPEKSYGNITLPQGEYEAFRVIIGKGEGHNWWCVMFPPLCFIDVTKGQVEEDESKEKLDEEVEKNKDKRQQDENESEDSEEDVHFKFKITEIFESIFG